LQAETTARGVKGMAVYIYRALDREGKASKGILEASSIEQAAKKLQARGMYIYALDKAKPPLWKREMVIPGLNQQRVKPQALMLFCRQLAALYKGGVPLVEAVHSLVRQTSGKSLQSVLKQMVKEMNAGMHFSQAAARHPEVFSEVFVNMAKAGEAGGNLDLMLERLAEMYEKEHALKEKLKTALAYPAFLGCTTVVVFIILMVFVVPRFEENYRMMKMELPLPTLILMTFNEWFQKFWIFIPIAIASGIIAIVRIRKSPAGRQALDRWKLKMPVIGRLRLHQMMARFCRTFSFLAASGVTLMDTLQIVSRVVDNAAAAEPILEARERLNRGNSFVEPFEREPLFPAMIVRMLKLGEASDSFDISLGKMAEFYEAETETLAERLKSVLEPIFILILTAVVGLIAFAIMMPSFSIIDQYQ
jgi:type IV pilus assembly protein PilC